MAKNTNNIDEGYVIEVPPFQDKPDEKYACGVGWSSYRSTLNSARLFSSLPKLKVSLRHMHFSDHRIVKVKIIPIAVVDENGKETKI
jgi:hypothetical protein